MVDLEFSGEIWFWKGPAPWYFVTIPADACQELAAVSTAASYGWGVIPVTAQIAATRFTTAVIPKDGRYLLPLKAAVRRAEKLETGDTVTVHLTVDA
jgi:hypothetical protein